MQLSHQIGTVGTIFVKMEEVPRSKLEILQNHVNQKYLQFKKIRVPKWSNKIAEPKTYYKFLFVRRVYSLNSYLIFYAPTYPPNHTPPHQSHHQTTQNGIYHHSCWWNPQNPPQSRSRKGQGKSGIDKISLRKLSYSKIEHWDYFLSYGYRKIGEDWGERIGNFLHTKKTWLPHKTP